MIHINFHYSDKYLKEQWVATGHKPMALGSINIDDGTLTPEQRIIIAPHMGTNFNPVNIALRTYEPGPSFSDTAKSSYAEFDHTPTLEEVLAFLPVMAEQKAAAEAEASRIKIEQEAKQEHQRALLKQQAEAERAKTQAEQEAKQRKIEERQAWIAAHGSTHLKKCVEKGYDCTRLYWIERAAIEYPGTALDYNKTATWNERKGPSLAALDKLDELESRYPDDEIAIVWLTDPATNQPNEEVYDPEFEAHEAIAIKPATYDGRWLVMDL